MYALRTYFCVNSTMQGFLFLFCFAEFLCSATYRHNFLSLDTISQMPRSFDGEKGPRSLSGIFIARNHVMMRHRVFKFRNDVSRVILPPDKCVRGRVASILRLKK